MQDCRQRFRAVLVEATVKLDELVKRIGRAVDDSKPYWEARKVAKQVRRTGVERRSPQQRVCLSISDENVKGLRLYGLKGSRVT